MRLPGFLTQNAPWLAAGGLLTFGSSFGQTFFISLYAGEIRAEFGLGHGDWGGIYAAGTLASAALMLLVGGIADRFRTRALATVTLGLFAAVCLAMATVSAAWLLPLVVFGLRFCGQGMMSHLAIVSVGRWFAAARGKAISVVAAGYSVGEAVLPFLFVSLAGWVGWRASWGIAAVILLAYVPLILLLLRRERSPRGVAEADHGAGMGGRHWRRGEVLRHWLFWACVPGLLAQPVFGTAFFFQQVYLTEIKGWRLEAFAGLFPVYTAASIAALMLGGAAVDRFGAGRVVPVFLLPLAAGLLVISAGGSIASAGLGMALMGSTHGLSAAATGAFWPEYFGTRHLGAIRSVATAMMVFATALGPLATGMLIDAGVDYNLQLAGMAAIAVAASVLFFAAFARARRLL